MSHINELQALVIVEHANGQYNLYLSDITGIYFALSLEDLVVTQRGIDLELVSMHKANLSCTFLVIDREWRYCIYIVFHRLMASMEL